MQTPGGGWELSWAEAAARPPQPEEAGPWEPPPQVGTRLWSKVKLRL